MFHTILIANRGEIACRVIKTAKRLGIRTVAVYSEADAAARHIALADEACQIGPACAAHSYLNADVILQAARSTGAGAIHPGYGFLAENADFAQACGDSGIVFVGPSPATIRAMGSKSVAKEIMARAGVPVIRGYQGADQNPQHLRAQADALGYPVLIKATAGGGGKGMRVVGTADDFDRALAGAKREAKASFGNDRVLIEKFLRRPRHIEMQIFADGCGNALHLFERDCSIQRRHQKVVEEAPAPTLDPATRDAMGEAAVTAVKAVDYLGAGTVEFLLDGNGAFYFMEMNTRLQVEHGVTELITGQDLVEWQLRVAAGEPLPCAPQDLAISGHAIEARVYAEDPERGFLPATGHLTHLRFPSDSRHLRIDTGVREGDAVTIHYDPMIAKLMVWDHDRAAALRRMRSALAATQVVGLATNIDFLASVFGHAAFVSGDYNVSFVEQHRDELTAVQVLATETAVALATLYTLKQRERQAAAQAIGSADPYSPWHLTQGWRLNEAPHERLCWHTGREEIEVKVYHRGGDYLIQTASGSLVAAGDLNAGNDLVAELNGVRLRATIVPEGGALTLLFRGLRQRLSLDRPAAMAIAEEVAPSSMAAPMPGRVVQVWVGPGDRVKRGDALLAVEAMKMEHTLTAPADGQVAAVNISNGDIIEEGIELLRFHPPERSNLPAEEIT